MESQDKKEKKPAITIPKTPQRTNPESENESHTTDAEHHVISSKDIDLSDEDKALDSGI